MTFPAHIRVLKNGNRKEHSVLEHCKEAAKYAKSCAAPMNAGKAAYLAALLHDRVVLFFRDGGAKSPCKWCSKSVIWNTAS